MTMADARRIADAVLFEGYVLYPYRSTSAKNKVRWQFGVLGPAGAADAGVGEEPTMQTELLLAPDPAGEPRITLQLRFLQVQYRAVEQAADTGGRFVPVDALQVGGTTWVGWHEAVEREVTWRDLAPAELASGRTLAVDVPGGEESELLTAPDGTVAGRLVRTTWPLTGRILLSAAPVAAERSLIRLTARLENLAHWRPADEPAGQTARDLAARQSFVGTHFLVQAEGGSFLSATDPPPWAAQAATACGNERCWPVLAGRPGSADVVLAAPIILADHPVIAEESPGDFFDATEIDEMLTLRVMTLTDAEKAEARGTDPRAAAIIDRCDTMTTEVFERLHGAVRSVDPPATPWWDPGVDASVSPEQDTVDVRGVRVGKGVRVLLKPTRRADAQDLFLDGLTAVVAAVYSDVDGQTHVAVTLEDDPAADLHAWYGRYYYFGPEELEPLGAREATTADHPAEPAAAEPVR